MCIILTTFVYLQCKFALQVQSKHIKILKIQKIKTKLKPTGILEGEKKKEKKRKEKVHLTNRINQKNTIHEPWALFI